MQQNKQEKNEHGSVLHDQTYFIVNTSSVGSAEYIGFFCFFYMIKNNNNRATVERQDAFFSVFEIRWVSP